MYHPHLATFRRGFINQFDAMIRQKFLCMKIPTPKGFFTIYGDKKEARGIEKGHTPGQSNVQHLDTVEEKKNHMSKPKETGKKLR
jgi:hypothetical protein